MLGTFGDIASLSVSTEGIRHCFASEFIVSACDKGNKDCWQLIVGKDF